MNDKSESCAESSYADTLLWPRPRTLQCIPGNSDAKSSELRWVRVPSDRLDAAFAARVIVGERQHAITLYLVVGGKYGRVPRVTRAQIIAVVAKEMGFPPICTPKTCTCTNARLKALHKKVREMTERLTL